MAQAMMSASSQWGYSVPLDETDGNARQPPQARRQTTQSSQQQQTQQYQERDYRTMKSGTRRPMGGENGGIQSDSEEARQRRRNVKAGNATATRKRSRNALRPAGAGSAAGTRDRSQDTAASQSNLYDSAWIHRDKLAQIEIQEMVDAGIPVRHSRRSMSAGPAVNERSSRSLEREDEDAAGYQQQSYEGYEEEYSNNNGYEEFERKRISTIDQADEEDQYYDRQQQTNGGAGYPSSQDTSTATANREVTPPWSPSHNSRPSTSRIPVSTASAVPVPSNVVGRDSPLPRSRHGGQAPSGNWEEMMHGRRVRSNSVGSGILLEDERNTSLPSPTSPTGPSNSASSPLKSRVPGKTVNGQRKGSIPTPVRPGSSAGGANRKQTPASPTTSTTTAQRSNSRSGHHAAPTGDPPWVTDMFKPDPRLPPDQQMLPTHAKRLAQQQWEREGKGTSSAYDREFRPMNDRDPSPNLMRDGSSRLGNYHYDSSDVEDVRNDNNNRDGHTMLDTSAHTLNQPINGNANNNNNNSSSGSAQLNPPETSSPTKSVGGGYKITPTITSPPEIRRSPTTGPYTSGAMGGMTAQAAANQTGLDEKGGAGAEDGEGKKERGCACCVVM